MRPIQKVSKSKKSFDKKPVLPGARYVAFKKSDEGKVGKKQKAPSGPGRVALRTVEVGRDFLSKLLEVGKGGLTAERSDRGSVGRPESIKKGGYQGATARAGKRMGGFRAMLFVSG